MQRVQSRQLPFLPTARAADHQRTLVADAKGIAVCSVNVTDSALFATADPKGVAACKSKTGDPIVSVETTHGVIRAATKAPYMFVSGISNRFGRFGDEVGGAGYVQTFPAAHNAGVVLCEVIAALNAHWKSAQP
jgi:hypothetical protein